MTDAEQREAARQFVNRWMHKGKEDEHGRSYWIDLLSNVLGMNNVTERVDFEKKVIVNGHSKRIDAYIPETSVIIEQKSLGIALDQKLHNSGDIDLTPYEQAKRYNDHLPYDERARWIVTSNFSEIWIYDMNVRVPEPLKISLVELQNKYPLLDFLVKKEVKKISNEMEVSIKAGDIVGLIYDAFYKQYRIPDVTKNEAEEETSKREHKLKSLNALCVRLVFCLYAEDAGIFGQRNMFHDYLEAYEVKDCRRALIELFKTLDTPVAERDEYLEEDLAQFPYVNGGLFADETIEIPPFTEEIKDLLLSKASEDFNWRDISPTIFGAVFESTLNPETRRAGGMHYTSIENIHKVIDPLFLDDLQSEFEEITNIPVKKTRDKKLDEFQNKLASLTFLDPACGSGNFLTETYLSLRRLENEVIQRKIDGQMTLGEAYNPIKVSIQQFYGIEINDFAVTVAKTALWIAESQMLEETKSIVYGFNDDFLPLKTYVNITGGNALRIDWESVVSKQRLNYIMGNPPFVANTGRISAEDSHSKKIMSDDQAEDREVLFGKNGGLLDYVACWYKKAALFIKGTGIKCAFVSTDSITQGQQVEPLWGDLFELGIVINFAYKSFKWKNDTNEKGATVFVVIIGFSYITHKFCYLYQENEKKQVQFINAYLLDAPNVIVKPRTKPICAVHSMQSGGKPVEGGHLIFNTSEKAEFISREPNSKKYFKRFTSGESFINGKEQWCLWLKDITPHELSSMPLVKERIKRVQKFRLTSKKAATRKGADTPHLFMEIKQPEDNYLLIPLTTSRNRRYVPIGFVSPDVIANNGASFVPSATIYDFGILTSNVHMAWMRTVCGYFGPSYRYSNKIVYNNFPWPSPTDAQKAKIEQTAQGILDARALYPDSTLADLYDPLTMPPELRKAHIANDKAVMATYGFSTKMTEADCVAELMKMYQRLTERK